MNISITKKFTFEAAHSISTHSGKCKNLHGHSYVLEVSILGPVQESGPAAGMVMDFADISDIVKREIINKWDHQFLNDIVPFVSTAENLALECFRRLEKSGLPVSNIKLWETATSYVEITQ